MMILDVFFGITGDLLKNINTDHLQEMMIVEISKAKKEVVAQVLEEFLNSDNIRLTQDELANIIIKKVA